MVGIMTVMNPRARKRRKMTAKQLQYFGPKRKRRAKSKVILVTGNPKRKRRSAATVARKRRRVVHRVKRNPVRRFRRNPIPMIGGMGATLMPAAIGAAGAVGVDWLLANVPIPQNLKTQTLLPLWRIGGAFAVGYLVSMVAGRKAGATATAGGIVVAAYAVARQLLAANVPGVQLARYVPMGRYMSNGGGKLGWVRRGKQLGAAGQQQRVRNLSVRRLRRLQGLQNQIAQRIATNQNRLKGLGPVPSNFPPGGTSRLGATSPHAVTKFRILRDGSTGGNRLGYVGPAQTLGRYFKGR